MPIRKVNNPVIRDGDPQILELYQEAAGDLSIAQKGNANPVHMALKIVRNDDNRFYKFSDLTDSYLESEFSADNAAMLKIFRRIARHEYEKEKISKSDVQTLCIRMRNINQSEEILQNYISCHHLINEEHITKILGNDEEEDEDDAEESESEDAQDRYNLTTDF